MISRPLLLLLISSAVLITNNANASICDSYVPGTAGFNAGYNAGQLYCRSAEVNGGPLTVKQTAILLDSADTSPGAAETTGVGNGYGSAFAYSGPGLVRAKAIADDLGSTQERVYVNSMAKATFLEVGTFSAISGSLLPTSLITARLTIAVNGNFSPSSGRGTGEFYVFRPNQIADHQSFFLFSNNNQYLYQNDITFQLGDTIGLYLSLYALANAANGYGPEFSFSSADLGNSGHLYFDVLTPGVIFDTPSGHNYSFVPLPSAFWLFGSSLVGLILAERRRYS